MIKQLCLRPTLLASSFQINEFGGTFHYFYSVITKGIDFEVLHAFLSIDKICGFGWQKSNLNLVCRKKLGQNMTILGQYLAYICIYPLQKTLLITVDPFEITWGLLSHMISSLFFFFCLNCLKTSICF